jgi:tetratricopeptide (TPR) repeat protein
MKRIAFFFFAWLTALLVCGDCMAADGKTQNPQPVTPPNPRAVRGPSAPRAAPLPAGEGVRHPAAPNNAGGAIDTNRRVGEARRQAQPATIAPVARDAGAKKSQPAVSQPTTPSSAQSNAAPAGYGRRHDYRYGPYNSGYYSPYGSPYGYSYSPYGYPYSPYGSSYSPYGYIPPGTTPYVLGYNPLTGATFLYPYQGGYNYNPYYTPGYSYPYYRNPYLGYGYPSAVFAPAGQLYGPGPIQQLMGVDHWFRPPQMNANPIAGGNLNVPVGGGVVNNANPGLANDNAHAGAAVHHDPDPPVRKKAASPSGKAMELAWKFVAFGDAHFGNEKYNDALDRYRRATRECPQLGDAWFRQGFALAAQGHYDQAARAMRRGLEEKPDWVDGNFRLDELYGDDTAGKKSRLDEMVKAAEADPTNGDLAFVVGVHLYCDGKPDQAEPFFRRTAQIRGSDADVKAFLAKGP